MTVDAAAAVPLLEARIDKLTQALFHLASELWVLRDRQAVLEHVLADAGLAAPGLIDSLRPDAQLTQTLAAQRDAFVAGIVAHLAPET